jgi:hypothetical protein
MFLGNCQVWILHLDTAFCQLVQGDLSVTEYCRRMKTVADSLCDLGSPVTDETLVLNLLRRLSPTCGPFSRGSPRSRPSLGFVMIFYSRNSRLRPPPPPTP